MRWCVFLHFMLGVLGVFFIFSSNNHVSAASTPADFSTGSPPSSAHVVTGAADSAHDNTRPHTDEHETVHLHVATVDFTRVETPFIIGLWLFCASLAKIGFHMAPKLSKIFPESCLLITVGVAIGLLLFHTSSVYVAPLTPTTFFLYMLPPIILDAGYFMPNRLFFDHLGTILLFAVVGTVWNTVTIGFSLWGCGLTGLYGVDLGLLDALLFSALISAVDPVAVLAVFEEIHVDELLYIVVFGESLLNDAVTVVLYHMFEAYGKMGPENIGVTDVAAGFASFLVVALGGTAIGVIWGFLTGFVTRFTNHVRVIEPLFVFVMAYLAYLNAEIFHFSGILAITFCGITMKNYVEANISSKSHTTVKYAMKMLSSSSETVIFMFLGVATVHDNHSWNTGFVLLTLLFCAVYRILGVIIFAGIANHFRLQKFGKVEKFVMSYGGLRGAVAFALVLLVDENATKHRSMFITATIATIYFTVFIQGITIKPLVTLLKVKRNVKRKPTMNERIHERLMDHLMAGVEDLLGHHGNHHIRDRFKRFDTRYIRPCLIRDLQGAEPKILETYTKLTLKDAITQMNSSNMNVNGGESMTQLLRSYAMSGQLGSSASLANNLENSQFNLDLQEFDYNPSKKDLSDANIHHMLEEEMYKPKKQRRLSYSRHAVNEQDLATHQPVLNYKMQVAVRRRISENVRKQQQKMLKRMHKEGSSPGTEHSSANGYLNPVMAVDPEDPLTPGRMRKMGKMMPHPNIDRSGSSANTTPSPEFKGEDTREGSYEQLPWRREDVETCQFPVRQSEFPPWCANKDYLAYSSPTNTFLGGLNKKSSNQSVIGLFKRDSVTSLNSGKRGSLSSLHKRDSASSLPGILPSESRRGSLASSLSDESDSLSGPLGTTSPRRFSSFVAVPIPEEVKEDENGDTPTTNEPSDTTTTLDTKL